MSARTRLRAWLLPCMLGVAACEGTETGNPDLSTGDAGHHAADGGGAPSDGGVWSGLDAGSPPPPWDAGWGPGQDAGGADEDGQVPDAPEDDLDAGVR